MKRRRDLVTVLSTTLLSWMGTRLTAVALPLVALAQTRSVWTTGLVAGCQGIPMVTSAWWAGRLRHRITGGRALAAVTALQAAGHLLVPVAAWSGRLSAVHLAASGLVVGAAGALAGPATRALLAQIGADSAVRVLTWQDLAHRVTMLTAPPLGALVVTAAGPMPLLWAESTAVALAAVALLTVGRYAGSERTRSAHGMRALLRRHPAVRAGILASGVGAFGWFGFSLGLAVRGAETGRPGQLIAAGLTGYGIASVVTALLAPRVVAGRRPEPFIVAGWSVVGAVFVALPLVDGSLPAIALLSAVGGALMPFGVAALNSLIVARTEGMDRHVAFAAEQIAHDGGGSAGLLIGGTVIALLGAHGSLVATGILLVVSPPLLFAFRPVRHPAGDPVTTGGRPRPVDGRVQPVP